MIIEIISGPKMHKRSSNGLGAVPLPPQRRPATCAGHLDRECRRKFSSSLLPVDFVIQTSLTQEGKCSLNMRVLIPGNTEADVHSEGPFRDSVAWAVHPQRRSSALVVHADYRYGKNYRSNEPLTLAVLCILLTTRMIR